MGVNKTNFEKTNMYGMNYFKLQLSIAISDVLRKYYNFPESADAAFNLPADFIANRKELMDNINRLVHNYLEVEYNDIHGSYPSIFGNLKNKETTNE